MKKMIAMIVLVACAAGVNAEDIDKLKTFYFGNSFLENTMVAFHPVLGESAGKTWEIDALIHPGVPIWVHAVRQDDPESKNYVKFNQEGPTSDAIVMLQFAGQGLKYVTPEMWGKQTFDPPRDVGDLASCASLIEKFLKMNPEGRAYVYTAWPNGKELGEFRDRVKDEVKKSLENKDLDRGQVMKKVVNSKAKAIVSKEVEPILEKVDFEELWLREDYIADCTPYEVRTRFGKYAGCIMRNSRDENWKPNLADFAEAGETTPEQVEKDLGMVNLSVEKLNAMENPRDELRKYTGGWYGAHSRPHNYALLEGLKEQFPEMWKDNRLGMIPVGDVMLALHRKIRDGQMPPLKSVQQFTEGHMRSGLPRYMLGATFYAVLFRDHPKNLSADIYAERENYINDVRGLNKPLGKYYVHVADLGRHIPITPERKKIVDDTIWEVVKGHPYTGIE